MKYYVNRANDNEVMASFDELLDLIQDGKHSGCCTRVVLPHTKMGNGIKYHVMSYNEISQYWKRISKERFSELCKDFGQFRHYADDMIKTHSLEIPKRKETFGI